MRKLNAIDAIGKRIAGGGTFAIVGAQAATAATRMDGVTRSATGVHTSFNRVAMRATGIGTAIASAGEVGQNALTKIANATASVAFGFGPQGAIVAAAAVAGLAIVSIFTRARKEMEETDKKARALLKSLTLETGVSKMTEIWSGDQLAKPGSPAALGLPGARARLAEIQAQEDADRGELSISQRRALSLETQELSKWIKLNAKDYADTEARVRSLTAAEVERNAIGLKREHEEYEKKQAEGARGLGITRGAGIFGDVRGAIDRISTDMDTRLTVILGKATDLSNLATATAAEVSAQAAKAPINKESGMIDAFNENAQRLADETAENMRNMIFMTFGDAIYQGFADAFSGKGLGGIFKSLGKTVLAGIGGIFKQLGSVWLAYGAKMFAFGKFLWNPATSGWAALAIGAALMAMGGALGAVGNRGSEGAGGGGAGYGGYGPNTMSEEVTRVRLMPGYAQDGAGVTARPNEHYNFTIIGEKDPAAQRMLVSMVESGKRQRG